MTKTPPEPSSMTDLKAIGASAHNRDLYARAAIDPSLLECFENPCPVGADIWEHISVPEFTCLCPITGQPDFAIIEILYAPGAKCVESKSLKLYLGSFRNVGTFHEACVVRIPQDLTDMLEPDWMLVVGRFTPRGGIPFQPRASFGSGVPRELLYRMWG